MDFNLTNCRHQDYCVLNCDQPETSISAGNFFHNSLTPKIKVIACLFLGLFLLSGKVVAQTDFAPGDIMFTGYKSDDADAFSFVILTGVVSGTVIYITDRGWSNTTGYRADTNGEGTISFTFNADYPCGTEFFFNDVGGANDWSATDAYGVIVGTVVIQAGGDPDGMELGQNGVNSQGDQLSIYQLPEPTSGSQGSFVCMIQMDNNLTGPVDTDEESELPTGLANNDIVRFNTEYDNAKYDCTPYVDTAPNLRTAITNDNGSGGLKSDATNNWIENDANNITLGPCFFCCGSTPPIAAPVLDAPAEVLTSQVFTITIAGTLAPGFVWQLYTAGCGSGSPLQTTTGSSFTVTAPSSASTVTYYVRSSQVTDCSSICGTVSVCVVGDLLSLCTDCNADMTICGPCLLPDPTPNPALNTGCYAMKVIFILDESGSIGTPVNYAPDVKAGVLSFLNALNGQDAQVALIEFSDLGRLVNDYHIVNSLYIDSITNYFNGIPYHGQTYNPNGGTNWHDAMKKADPLTPNPNLILFFTDGEPNFYTNAAGIGVNCFAGTLAAAIVNPVKYANKFKSEGTHMFMLGVGGANQLNLERMSGFVPYQSGINTLATSDFSIGDFATLAEDLQAFILELCRTNIKIIKDVLGPVCNGKVQFRFRVINLGTVSAATNVIVTDTFPNGYANIVYTGPQIKFCVGTDCDPDLAPNGFQWVPFSVPPGDTVTLILTVDYLAAGIHDNTAHVTADNADGASSTFLGNTLTLNLPPAITCPANVTIACSASTLPASTGNPTASDPDGAAPTVTYSDVTLSGSCPQNHIINRTWTATDACLTTATCIQVITTKDLIAPITSCPPNITIACDANTSPANTGTATGADLCDPSPTITFTDATVAGACPQAYTIKRTWTATDHCGNFSTCLQNITLNDNVPPVITCMDKQILCSESILPTNPNLGFPPVTNNCGGTSTLTYADIFVYSPTNPQCSILRTWTAVDQCGNSNTCLQTIIVKDLINPTIFCPGNVTIPCSASTLPGNTGSATSTDNCSIFPTISYIDAVTVSPVCVQNKTISRTWKAFDECGNSSTCTQTITVVDNVVPSISCPVNVTIACSVSTLPASTGTATATDNCSTLAVTSTDVVVIGSCPQEKIITRTWKAIDACGNSSSCNQTIVVHDTSPPSLTCPTNITLDCAANTLPANTGTATATDNCSTFTVTSTDVIVTGSCPQSKTITRTWKATDACGNFGTCNQIITVIDNTPPVMNCPVNVTLDCTASTLPANTGTASATDNCSTLALTSTDVIVTGICPQEKTITRTWKATDACGNFSTCIQTLIVHDTSPPSVSCPVNVTISCTASTLPANTGTASATDNCSTIAITSTDAIVAGICPQEKIITRTWKALDACGNSSTCNQTITVDDFTPPSIACPGNVTIECTASTLPANTGTATASDNCSTFVITSSDVNLPGDCPQNRTIIRTWKALDACGNSSTCNQVVTIHDSTNPTMSCPPNVTIECTASTLPANTGTASASDNCSTFAVTSSDVTVAGGCPQAYIITRTWKAQDACGNSTTCNQIISIHDSTPPLITCPANLTIQCIASTLPANTGSASATDNCDAAPITTFNDVTITGPTPLGISIFRTWKATDHCGNSSTCLQTITVQNPLNPQITGAATDTICSGQTEVFQAQNQGIGGVTYQWNFGSGSSPGTATGIGPHTVVYNYNGTNGSIGAYVVLTVSFPGCLSASDTVANIHVNPIPDPTIDAPTTNLCYFKLRTFKPLAAQVPGYTYQWNFGSGASQPPTSGYGPWMVKYSTTGVKTVQLIVFSNAAGASCGDTATLTFTVIACQGNITGKVKLADGTGIGSVNVKLYPDNNLDGLPDPVAPVRSVNTVSTGIYSMVGLVPGQYVVVEAQPNGYVSISDMDETNDMDTIVYSNPNDNIIPVTLEPSELDADNNFVEAVSPGIITGYTFQDLNNNLIPDPGEGIPGVTISLYTDTNQDGLPDSGGLINTTVTSAIGWYQFGDVPVGDYVVKETQPAGYTSAMDIDVTNDLDAVMNASPTDDLIPVSIFLGETDADNDFIEIQGCGQIVTNTNDDGPGSLRFVLDCSNSGDTITFSPFMQGQTIHLTSSRIEVDKNLYIHSTLTPRVKIQSDISGAFLIDAGQTAEFENIDVTSGLSGNSGAAFENYGHLIFWDMYIYRNALLLPNNYLIFNSTAATITIKGGIQIDN